MIEYAFIDEERRVGMRGRRRKKVVNRRKVGALLQCYTLPQLPASHFYCGLFLLSNIFLLWIMYFYYIGIKLLKTEDEHLQRPFHFF